MSGNFRKYVRIDEAGQQKASTRVDHAVRAHRGRGGVHVDDALSLDGHMAFADDLLTRLLCHPFLGAFFLCVLDNVCLGAFGFC